MPAHGCMRTPVIYSTYGIRQIPDLDHPMSANCSGSSGSSVVHRNFNNACLSLTAGFGSADSGLLAQSYWRNRTSDSAEGSVVSRVTSFISLT